MQEITNVENKIIYATGNAADPGKEKKIIIAHVCNDAGGWGAGFVLALSRKWKQPEREYRNWYAKKLNFILGETQFVQVEENVLIANMLAQHGYKNPFNKVPLQYDALKECLEKVCDRALKDGYEVQMPRIGAGLAGGEWCKIEEIINETLVKKNVRVIVLDLPTK